MRVGAGPSDDGAAARTGEKRLPLDNSASFDAAAYGMMESQLAVLFMDIYKAYRCSQ
jgi:hypothetical protein